jgi:hypothetical protein
VVQWADFSGRPPGAAALKASGFAGVIRYIGLGSEGKQIHRAEYVDYVHNGVDVLLVAELTISDAWAALDDRATGVARAQLAVADARAEGIPDSVPIAWAADSHATAAQVRDAVEYGRGFQAVLGSRSGAYGFMETLRAVRAAGGASWYWLAGAKPSAADQAWVNIWQRNDSTRTVGGVVCDINETYAPMGPHTLEDEVSWTETLPLAAPGDRSYVEPHKASEALGDTFFRVADMFQWMQNLVLPQLATMAAAMNGELDQAAVLDRMDTAVREATAATITNVVLPALKAVLGAAQGVALTPDQIDAIADEFGRRLQQNSSA